jgi:hypothetical protein
MTIENNPLKQYFRRPAVYFKLPSGGKDYNDGVIDFTETGELPVYPMTAIDEITARTPDALFNGTAVVELIKSCIPNIKDPWKVSSNDLDAILIAIRIASGNGKLEIESTCTKCSTESKYDINLSNVLTTLKSGDYTQEHNIGELTFKFRPLVYKEMNEASLVQNEASKFFQVLPSITDENERNTKTQEAIKKVTELTIDLISKCIEHVRTPNTIVTELEYIKDFLSNCDGIMYTQLRDLNTKLKEDNQLKPLQVDCINCHHKYEQTYSLNPTDFFG